MAKQNSAACPQKGNVIPITEEDWEEDLVAWKK